MEKKRKIIYCDNSATTLIKPFEVAKAVSFAINNFASPSRSFNESALLATREVYRTREELAKLIDLDDPLQIAFTSNATESINLVINSLINKGDHVITSILDHNAVLRPLYNSACELSFLSIKDNELDYASLDSLVKTNTKAIIINHISNVTGYILDTNYIKDFCHKKKILFILDISQSLGSYPVKYDMADIMCFTGHKSLFGPQGTGGIITNKNIKFEKVSKTGGAGSNSFNHLQSLLMPDIFEVGTMNAHSLYGLQKGILFINDIGINKIIEHKKELMNIFVNELKKIDGIIIYGKLEDSIKSGVISINYQDKDSADFSQRLYEINSIATRAQSHCAPLVHEYYKTKEQGMTRFSFSYFNKKEEIEIIIASIKEIIKEWSLYK